jgi:hypothetical protein
MPEILPTWKVEIRRIMVSGQLDQKKKNVGLHLNRKKARCGSMYLSPQLRQKHKIGLQTRPTWAKNKTLSPKQTDQKGLEV